MIKIFGIPFKIHPLFWVTLAMCFLTGYIWNACIVFSIVFIHEMGHTLAAKWFSWEIEEVMIFPFGGVLKVSNHGAEPIREALIVTIAGPLQHAIIPIFSYFLLYTPFWNSSLHHLAMMYNLTILLFNLLPIWPLDGAKLLSFLLMVWLPFKKAMMTTILFSLVVLLCCAIGLNIRNIHVESLLITVFFGLMLWSEWRLREVVFVRFLLSKWHLKKRKTSVCLLHVSAQDTLAMVAKRLYKTKVCIIHIKESEKRLSETQVLDYYFNKGWIHRTLSHILSRE